MKQKLQFVYNAETGVFNKLTDFAHKIVSPGTYACSLCALTYGKFTMKKEWAEYVKKLPIEVEFVYKSEWKFAPLREEYPVIALQTGNDRIEILIEAEELDQIKNLDQLKSKLNAAIKNSF